MRGIWALGRGLHGEGYLGSWQGSRALLDFTKDLCTSMVYTWALNGLLYPSFGVYACTIQILGHLGFSKLHQGFQVDALISVLLSQSVHVLVRDIA